MSNSFRLGGFLTKLELLDFVIYSQSVIVVHLCSFKYCSYMKSVSRGHFFERVVADLLQRRASDSR